MLLKVSELNTYYGASHILQGISLHIAAGEIVGLLGRNGMGKSTALKSIIGLVKPKTGSVVYEGKEYAGSACHKVARAGIGYVPEERRIFPELSVLDNLLLGIKKGKVQAAAGGDGWTVERIFHHFPKLRDRIHQQGRYLSGGEQQMLSIGRALMGNPKLLLVDEPTEGLAPLMVEEVRNVLAEINKAGVSILLVEHNLNVALSLATRVYLMGKGFIGYSGTIDELQEDDEARKKYLLFSASC